LGHITSKCLNKRVVTLAEYQSFCENVEEVEKQGGKELFLTKEMEEYDKDSDKREMFVVGRALSGLATSKS